MKKVLFILRSAEAGGTCVSLLNLLEFMKEKGQVCDLLLLEQKGCFLNRARQCANLLPEEPIIASLLCEKSELSRKGLKALMIRSAYTLLHRIFGEQAVTAFFYRLSTRKLGGQYDVVIAYQEDTATEYAACLKASRKISWFHTDFNAYWAMRDGEILKQLYANFDSIVCVTESSRQQILEKLHKEAQQVQVIHNTIPASHIRSCAEKIQEEIPTAPLTFVSLGRFCEAKCYERAIAAGAALKQAGFSFLWYLIGEGECGDALRQQIRELGLEDCFSLPGLQENPYPYMAKAQCLVICSRYEAQPMVANEALTLGVPVISTDFSSVHEVLTEGRNGLIVENSTKGIVEGVMRFAADPDLRFKLKAGAEAFSYDNDTIVEQVLSLLD